MPVPIYWRGPPRLYKWACKVECTMARKSIAEQAARIAAATAVATPRQGILPKGAPRIGRVMAGGTGVVGTYPGGFQVPPLNPDGTPVYPGTKALHPNTNRGRMLALMLVGGATITSVCETIISKRRGDNWTPREVSEAINLLARENGVSTECDGNGNLYVLDTDGKRIGGNTPTVKGKGKGKGKGKATPPPLPATPTDPDTRHPADKAVDDYKAGTTGAAVNTPIPDASGDIDHDTDSQ